MRRRGDNRGGAATAQSMSPAEFRDRVVEPALRRRDELTAEVAAAEGALTELLGAVAYDELAAEAAEERLLSLQLAHGRMERRLGYLDEQARTLKAPKSSEPLVYDPGQVLQRLGETPNEPVAWTVKEQAPRTYGCGVCHGNNDECAYCGGNAYRRRHAEA